MYGAYNVLHMNTEEHKAPNTVTFTVRMPREAKDQLENLAKNMGRSTNYVATEAIEAYVAENAWQVERIRQAVEQADAGGPFYHHEDMVGYFEAKARGENPEW